MKPSGCFDNHVLVVQFPKDIWSDECTLRWTLNIAWTFELARIISLGLNISSNSNTSLDLNVSLDWNKFCSLKIPVLAQSGRHKNHDINQPIPQLIFLNCTNGALKLRVGASKSRLRIVLHYLQHSNLRWILQCYLLRRAHSNVLIPLMDCISFLACN